MAINVEPLGDRVLGSPRWDSCCGLFSVPASAIWCAWRNVWHEKKDSGVALSEEEWSGEYGACCDATPSLDWPAERLDGSRSERQTSTLKGKKQMHNTRNAYEPSQSSIA